MDIFRVRLNCVDHYQASPTPYDPQLRRNVSASQLQNEPKVPVIRVFGSTQTGQKVCAHIHGAFPYLYVEYGGDLASGAVETYIQQMHLSIDHALAVSYRRNAYDGQNKYVARITLVKGVPFYGYQVGYRYYLKIYVLNPTVMTRLSDVLRQGAVMKRIFQPYEAHLQYLLQWMADYNLYGCGYINCRQAYFRTPVPKLDDMDSLYHLWHDRSIPAQYLLGEDTLPRVSHCSLEVDICVQDILNRKEIRPRLLHHDFVEFEGPAMPQEKLVHSMEGLWKDETSRRKAKMMYPDPGSSPFPAEVLISMSADTRNSQPGGWIHEEEYIDSIRSLVMEEKGRSIGDVVSFRSFVKTSPFDKSIKTALESVEDLYPDNLGPALGLKIEPKVEKRGNQETGFNLDRLAGAISREDLSYDSDEDFFGKKASPEAVDALDEYGLGLFEDFGDLPDADIDLFSGYNSRINKPKVYHGISQPTFAMSTTPMTSSNPARQGLDRVKTSSSVIGAKRPAPDPFAKSAFEKRQRIDGQPYKSVSFAPSMSKSAQQDASPPERPQGFRIPDFSEQRPTYGTDQSYLPLSPTEFRSYQIPVTDNPQKPSYQETSRGLGKEAIERPTGFHISTFGEQRPIYGTGQSYSQLSPTEFRSYQIPVTDNPQKPSSQETLKGYSKEAIKPLGFPIVKHPQYPSTVSRPSQTQPSRKSGDASPNSMVSIDPQSGFDVSSEHLSSLEMSNTDRDSADQVELATRLLSNMKIQFPHSAGSKYVAISSPPPDALDVVSSFRELGLPSVIYQEAYYSNESDVPPRPREWAGREFKLESLTVPFLADFDPTGTSLASIGKKPRVVPDKAKDEAIFKRRRRLCTLRSWEYAEPPPSVEEVVDWLKSTTASRLSSTSKPAQAAESPKAIYNLSQIDGPTQKNKNSTRYTQQQNITSVQHEVQYMSIMSLEIHVNTRDNLVPNPEEDEVQCIFWCLQSDDGSLDNGTAPDGTHVGIVTLSPDGEMSDKIARELAVDLYEEMTELDLLIRMVEIVRKHDPDILTGYEVHSASWGYLIERARLKYDYNLCDEFSRMKAQQSFGRSGRESDRWGFNTTSTIRVTGRHMINIWRAMSSELNLLQYTIENVVFHLLQRRIPHYSWKDLTQWYSEGRLRDLRTVLRYYVSRVRLDLQILERNELIPRTSEQARLLGVDFFSVFSRGSQYKVESLMFRIAKPENFILVSPSRKQVGGQNALECLPMVMEPQSAFYTSPVLVLDFQSLYPSVMIAYNYCYSTFLGRIVDWRRINKMGFTDYKRQHRLLELLQEHINIAPNGMMYVKPEIRKSLLAKMLGEILETRVMVKSGMKIDKDDKILQSLLNNRQLALKLIANVTYGYTSASFSGRMPCSEIADSIVQTARETLEKSIALIHSINRWGAEVVYGDTDSLFVHLKGRTKEEAFDIGEEITKSITDMNPRPVKLKFEKVYLPCVLLAKKRYVGFKYESRDQKEPEFDAKGIETVRRDGTPAEQKIEEKTLKILFRTADLSQVKSYFQTQCEKIMRGSISIQDFCFAKEVRLGTYSEKGVHPAGALISTRRMLEDSRAEPQYGERVPYVVVTGAPGARLIDRCVAPEALLESDRYELDVEYYITKNIIPPLERIFNLVGANVRSWYDEMPKVRRIRRVDVPPPFPYDKTANVPPPFRGRGGSVRVGQKTLDSYLMPPPSVRSGQRTLESYLTPTSCVVCRAKVIGSKGRICEACLAKRPASLLALRTRLNRVEKKCLDLERVCKSCSGIPLHDEVRCDSKDCPVFYSRMKQTTLLRQETATVEPSMSILQAALDW